MITVYLRQKWRGRFHLLCLAGGRWQHLERSASAYQTSAPFQVLPATAPGCDRKEEASAYQTSFPFQVVSATATGSKAWTATGSKAWTAADRKKNGEPRRTRKAPRFFVATLKAALLFRVRNLFYYAQFFAYFGEGGNAFVQVRALVGGRDLYADTGLSLGNYRVVETGNVDAFVQQTGSHVLA